MGMHSDDEASLGNTPTIASYSLGAERTLVFKHRTRKDAQAFPLILSEGNLLIIRGVTQKFWLHGINKTTRKVGPRVNLTFRDICSS
jgi:alkylated DNA repair dioxygenase AlkB